MDVTSAEQNRSENHFHWNSAKISGISEIIGEPSKDWISRLDCRCDLDDFNVLQSGVIVGNIVKVARVIRSEFVRKIRNTNLAKAWTEIEITALCAVLLLGLQRKTSCRCLFPV
jgi:hypothetical protein